MRCIGVMGVPHDGCMAGGCGALLKKHTVWVGGHGVNMSVHGMCAFACIMWYGIHAA